MTRSIESVVLVHGAWHGSWCWARALRGREPCSSWRPAIRPSSHARSSSRSGSRAGLEDSSADNNTLINNRLDASV